MLFEKNTLFGLLSLWLTDCRAVLPGHMPLAASASTSVPGAPASSLATGSQVEVLKPGAEICAPVADVLALLSTDQPVAPRSVMSLAPVLGAAIRAVARVGAAVRLGPAYAVIADVMEARDAITSTAAAASAGPERIEDLMSDSQLGTPPLGAQIWRLNYFVCLSYICVNGHLIGRSIAVRSRGSGLDLGQDVVPGPVQAGGETAENDGVPAEHRHLDRGRREREQVAKQSLGRIEQQVGVAADAAADDDQARVEHGDHGGQRPR